MSIKIYKDGKWQLFPGTGVGGSTNSYTKEESDNKYALKSDVTAVSGKVDDLEERIDQINTGGNCEDCISQSELESAISGVNSKIDNLVTAVSGKVDTGSYLFTLNGDQVNQGDSINIAGSGTSITIDSALDINSENPVQNKVVTSKLNYLESGLFLHGEEISYIETRVGNYELANDQKNIVSGTTQVSWQHITKDSPLYLKTINGVSIIGNSEDNNITISGGSGTVPESKPSVIVFAYIQSNEKPSSEPNVTVDSEGNPSYTGEWKSISDMSDAISNKLQIWYSYATFVAGGNIIGNWSDPIPFAKDGLPGQDGNPGKDGTDGIGVEYIYYRSNDNVIPSLPANANSWEWDNVPENAGGWTDNPTGVDKDHQFEFVSVRTGNAININPWSLPTLWSKYGVNGVDGDTIEYIYALTTDITIQPSTPDNSWEYDNPQLPWHDNPQSVSESDKVCWVSVRKKSGNSDTWGDWSTPAVWSKWSEDGKTPDAFYSALVNIYKRADSLPAKPDDGQYIYNFEEGNITSGNLNGWSINIPDNTAKYLYQCSAYVTSNGTTGVINSWSDPICIASNGENGSGQSAVYLDLTNDSPYIITDSEGNITSEQTVTTNVHMYYGTTEQNLTSLTIGGNSIGTQTANPSTKTVTITYPEGTAGITSTLTYTITATANINDDPDNSVSKSIVLNVVPVKQAEDGKSPVIYTLTPSANTIVLDPNSESCTPSYLQCAVTRIEGNTSERIPVNTEDITVQYQIDNGELNNYNQQFNITYAALETCSSLTFILNVNNEDGIYEIKQVIPILRNGSNGTNGSQGPQGPAGDNGKTPYILSIDNDHFTIAVDNDGKVIADQTILSVLHLYHENEYEWPENDGYTIEYKFDNTTVDSSDSETEVTIGKAPIASLKSGYPIWIKFPKGYNIVGSSGVEDTIDVITVDIYNGLDVVATGAIKVRYSNAGIYNLILTPHTVVIDENGSKSVNQLTAQIQKEIITSDFKESIILTGSKIPNTVIVKLINDTSNTETVESFTFTRPVGNKTEFTLDITGITFQSNPYVVIKDEFVNLDREDLAVVKDGQNGSNGSNGYTQQVLQIYQRSNTELTAPGNTNHKISDLINNTWMAPGSWDKEIPDASSSPCYMSTAFIRFDASKTNETITATWSKPVKILENGTGSDGRMLYPAGIWNSAAPYTRTDTATPFVLYEPTNGTPAYYVLIAESSGNIEPGTNADVWKLMESLDVAYANVMMAEMGTIGDATFYNNLMFSKNDASGNQVSDKTQNLFVTNDDGTTSINMDSSNKPTMAIDFNSGNAYFANGNIICKENGDILVKNLFYDVRTSVVSSANKVESLTDKYQYFTIESLACVLPTNDAFWNIMVPSGTFDHRGFVFKLPDYTNADNNHYNYAEGVLINNGDLNAIIYNSAAISGRVNYHIYYRGKEIKQIILPGKSTLSYIYNSVNTTNTDLISYYGDIYLHNAVGTISTISNGYMLTLASEV